MPFLGYLFAPRNPLSNTPDNAWHEHVCSWIHAIDTAWRKKRGALATNFSSTPAYRNLSTNMACMPPSRCRALAPDVEPVAEALLEKWRATKGELPMFDAALFAESTGIASQICLQNLTGYRGGFKEIPAAKLKRGGTLAFLNSSSDPYDYKFGREDEVEANIFLEIVRASGGDGLALWSWGRSIGLLLARTNCPPTTRVAAFGPFYIAPGKRTKEHIARMLEKLRQAFEGSAFQVDWKSVEQQLAAEELSATAWCAAFGLPQAPEATPANAAEAFEAWERASAAILGGQKAAPPDVKIVNSALEKTGCDTKLPTKPASGDGQVAYKLANVQVDLEQRIGWPEDTRWAKRGQAAELYSRIVDGDGGDWLTVGLDAKNYGASASLGRLLQCYPAEWRRDRAWALHALHHAEVWNGHSFVTSLAALAEGTAVKLVLIVYQASLRDAFRKEFGIDGGAANPDPRWEAEAFIETSAWPKKKPSEAATAWLAKKKANAVIFSCEDQASAIRVLKAGADAGSDPTAIGLTSAPAAEVLQAAASQLDPGKILETLGIGPVLRAPELEAEASPQGKHRAAALAALAANVPEIRANGAPGEHVIVDPPYVEGTNMPVRRVVALEVRGLSHPELTARDLSGHLGKITEVWVDNGNLYACQESSLEWRLLAPLLGDLPPGSQVKLVNSDGAGFCLLQE